MLEKMHSEKGFCWIFGVFFKTAGEVAIPSLTYRWTSNLLYYSDKL